MQRLDAHQHFWKFDQVKDAWITDDMSVLKRDFYHTDLEPVLAANEVSGCIAVQAAQSEVETMFLVDQAKRSTAIKGVVGWVDLTADGVDERLQYFRQYSVIKGFRHIIQAEPKDFMADPKFRHGMSLLGKYGYTFDLLIKVEQLVETAQLVAAFPDQPFVIDHLAKPAIVDHALAPWETNIRALAAFHNVYCKVSGFCTEADWHNWTEADIKPYLDVVFDAFGNDRVMFGSDWPVCLVAGGYSKTVQCLETYLHPYSHTDKAKFWALNAAKFYRLVNI